MCKRSGGAQTGRTGARLLKRIDVTENSHSASAIRYRPDIDGLRAVAILGVLGYHFGLGVPGGYGGVDVFFVISGFLIAGIIKAQIDADTFSLIDFYWRRMRRIVPALIACLAVTTVAASAILFPFDFRTYGQSLNAVATATSNFFFTHLSTRYFGAAASDNPLLHTWSLSIEEQFYAVFPLTILLLSRYRRRLVLPAMALVAVASLGYAARMVSHQPVVAFFSTGGRIWELLTGTMLAFAATASFSRHGWREGEAVLGAAAILAGYFLYTAQTPFPGLAAVPLCLGAALVIHSGMPGTDRTPTLVARGLSSPVAVGIGKISYSVYLWHWPLLVMFHYRLQSLGEFN